MTNLIFLSILGKQIFCTSRWKYGVIRSGCDIIKKPKMFTLIKSQTKFLNVSSKYVSEAFMPRHEPRTLSQTFLNVSRVQLCLDMKSEQLLQDCVQ